MVHETTSKKKKNTIGGQQFAHEPAHPNLLTDIPGRTAHLSTYVPSLHRGGNPQPKILPTHRALVGAPPGVQVKNILDVRGYCEVVT